jgi:hypothetical protein
LDLGGGPGRDTGGVGDRGDDDASLPSSGRDASDGGGPVKEPPPPPGHVLPQGYICYGDATSVPGVTCGSITTSGTTCTGELDCTGDHRFTMSCKDGICECINVGFNRCYCEAPAGIGDPCVEANCCWR